MHFVKEWANAKNSLQYISDGSGYALLWKILKFAKKAKSSNMANFTEKAYSTSLKKPIFRLSDPILNNFSPDPSLIYKTNSSNT